METTCLKTRCKGTNPAKAFLSPTLGNTCHTYYFAARCSSLLHNFPTELFCKQSPVYGVFDRYFHITLPIVTKYELGLPLSPRNHRIKFGANLSTIFLVIVVTNRHTHTHEPTPVKTYSLAITGIMTCFYCPVGRRAITRSRVRYRLCAGQ